MSLQQGRRDAVLSLNAARAKAIMSSTARWHAVEFTNSIPDESFTLTWYDLEIKPVKQRDP
jgi:hypothetical protein